MNEDKSADKWIKLCDNTEVCQKRIRAVEGDNTFRIKAVGDDSVPETVSFFVDSIKPRILKTSPLGNSFVNGSLFSISYIEKNLEDITLFYGNAGDIRSEINKECLGGNKTQQCDFELDISEFDGESIDFWFEVNDGINVVTSKRTRVKVDTTSPKIVESSITSLENNRVKFVFEIDEANFRDIILRDFNDCGIKYNPSELLCGNLNYGRCVVTKNFCKGSHELTITVRDKAGNVDELSEQRDI
jgi:hypothetical protein